MKVCLHVSRNDLFLAALSHSSGTQNKFCDADSLLKPNIYINNCTNHFYNTAEEYIFIFKIQVNTKFTRLNIELNLFLLFSVWIWLYLYTTFWLKDISDLTAASFLFIPIKFNKAYCLVVGRCTSEKPRGDLVTIKDTHSNIGCILKDRIRKVLISSYRQQDNSLEKTK